MPKMGRAAPPSNLGLDLSQHLPLTATLILIDVNFQSLISLVIESVHPVVLQ